MEVLSDRYVTMLREKEERLLQMGNEISRLTMSKNESSKKDEEIQKLRQKILQVETAASVSLLGVI